MNEAALSSDRRHEEPFKDALEHGRRRYFDKKRQKNVVRVMPGDHYITKRKDEMIVTVLGSCVAACIRDPETGVGGMNHFMLPESSTGKWGSVSANMRYGNFAMETLINKIIKSGCPRERLEVKLFGGGNVIPGKLRVGDQNGKFALHYLQYEELKPLAVDLGGNHARRIHYFPETGKVDRLLLKRTSDVAYLKEENDYRTRLPGEMGSGEIDLF